MQDLQKENLAATQRNKLLESENSLLLSETEQLRQVCLLDQFIYTTLTWSQEVKILEDNIDQSLLREEQALTFEDDINSTPVSDDVESLQRQLKEQKMKLEVLATHELIVL